MSSDNAVPSSRVSGFARLLRGWTVTVIAVMLAAGGHQAAHSIMHGATDTIPVELLGFSMAITAPIAVGLAGKRLATWSTVVVTVVGQVIFHALYSLPSSGVPSVYHANSHQHGLAPVTDAHPAHTMLTEAITSVTASGVMFLAHIAAATLTTGVIVYGERCLMAIVGWLLLAPTRLVLAALPVSIMGPKVIQPISRIWLPSPIDASRACSTRGPPVYA